MATSSPATPSTPDASRERSESAVPTAKRIKTEHSSVPSTSAPIRQNDFARTHTPSLPPVPSSAAINSTSHYRTAVQPPGQEQRDNLESLVDVMGSSGIDLRAEEEAIQRRGEQLRAAHQHQSAAAGRSRQTTSSASQHYDDELYLQVYPLAYKVHTIAQKHGLSVDAAVLNYLSLAARMRIKNLLESMVASSRHRSWSSHQHPPPLFPASTTPLYHEQISTNPVKQLAALEKAERGDEARRRKDRLARDAEAAALASGTLTSDADMEAMGGGDDGMGNSRMTGAKKTKKIGPGVAARNMSEDVRKRLADSTAMRNLGGGGSTKYSWLSGSNNSASGAGFNSPLGGGGGKKQEPDAGGSRLPKPKFAPQPPLNGTLQSDDTPIVNADRANSTGAWGDVAVRQAAKVEAERQARLKVTLRDALFALEYERRGGAGYGSGEALLYRLRARNPRTNLE